MSFNVKRNPDGQYRVICSHGNMIRDFTDATYRVVSYRPPCGCYEVEVCLGCGKEDCDGCPCGTTKTIRETQND